MFLKESVDRMIQISSIIEQDTSSVPDKFELLKKEALNYPTPEALLRAGGFSNDALDLTAFGVTEDLNSLMPNQLKIKWKDDYSNVQWEITKSGLSPLAWAKQIDLSEPIEVSLENGGFYIEDGHHRYTAAKIRKVPLNVELTIKDNPVIKLGFADYDQMHIEIWKAAHGQQ